MEAKTVHEIPVDYSFNSELKEQKFVRSVVKPGMTVLDLGAHLGKYTKLFSLLVGETGKVFVFEPTPESYHELKTELDELNVSNVGLYNKAVYSEDTTLTFYQFPKQYSSWNGIGLPKMPDPQDDQKIVNHEKTIEIEAVAVDTFCGELNIPSIDYLKLDVEGAEIFALKGMRRLLTEKAIKYLQFEISKNMLDGLNTKASYVFEYLHKHGYDCYEISEEGNRGKMVKGSDAFYENYIAIPRENVSVTENDAFINEIHGPYAFTDKGYWTPQTAMLRSIRDIVQSIEGEAQTALSVDTNPTLNQILKSRWPSLQISESSYPQFDAQHLYQFADETFDIVFSHQVLEHIPKPWIAAKEMTRILKKGGVGIHSSCAFNPRHGYPDFNDYYRFLPDGLAELFDGVNIWIKDGWGNREAMIYNLAIDDGFGQLGGRRFVEALGGKNDINYPWVTWVIFQKK